MRRASITRIAALVSTVALSWGVLTLGFADEAAGGPQVGDTADREYRARTDAEFVDQVATEQARERARASVEPVLVRDSSLEDAAYAEVSGILDAVAIATQPIEGQVESVPPPTSSTTSSTTTTTTADGEPVVGAETGLVSTGIITGLVFIDVNGDGVLDDTEVPEDGWTTDRLRQGVQAVAIASDGTQYRGTTDRSGEYSIEVPHGEYEVLLDSESTGYPPDFVASAPNSFSQEIVCESDECPTQPVGLSAVFAPLDSIVDDVQSESPLLGDTTWAVLADYGMRDVYRTLFDDEPLLQQISTAAQDRLTTYFRFEITDEEVDQIRSDALRDPQSVQIDGAINDVAREQVNRLVSVSLVANMVADQERTDAEIEREVAAVPDQMRSYSAGQLILAPGDTFTERTLAAVNATGANIERTVRQAAAGGLLAVLVAVLAYYLARFRKVYWSRPRMVTLFGMLIVMAAAAVRITIEFQETTSWYILPAVAFGYLASVLFDNRMGTLMAMAVGVLALVGTLEPGVGVYATLATLAPIGFVSSVSTRRAFRNSVLVSAIAGAVIAAAASWFFEAEVGQSPFEQIGRDAAWAGAVALVASLVALAAMPFFESMFDITTTLRLLELTDRNHEALQVLQSKAFGTFNHSLMVGTLADSAAKAIGADNILARAAAYYHDLGKTENPMYFIENQFGSANPHDGLAPEESARIIRQHVLDGVDLARKFNIPSAVAEGIVSHHGDGIMRYFYEKARQQGDTEVDPDLFRHAGHKPQTREMAILMMADAVEGACRAVFADEEPKPESIAKVVNRVIDEKVADGQLSESDLTLSELSTVRRAFIDALTGHYHQRIPYPNFPGS